MANLPGSLTIPAALIWITIRDFEACQGAFEADEAFQREPYGPNDDKTTATVSVWKLGLLSVSCIIAKYLHPGDSTIRDKWGTFELDDGWVRPKGKKRETAAVNYEYAQAERELIRALRDGDITAYTIGSDNVRREVHAALWLGRELDDQVGEDGHYHVVATATGKEPLRDIVFEKDDILRKWPPDGGKQLDSKIAEVVSQISPLKATAEVQGHKFKKQYQWESAEEYLNKFKPILGVRDPFFGLRERTIEYVAEKCGCTKGAAKQSVGELISERIRKMRKEGLASDWLDR